VSRKALLDIVAAEVVVCVKCPLSKSRKNAVPGEGNLNADIMLIGEAPGKSEDLEGRPFVGAAGKFLETLLAEIGLARKDVFIGNVVKCRPPRNREPRPMEIQTCTPYLERQIRTIQPKFIVTLGKYSTQHIFSKAGLPFNSITQARGKFYKTSILGLEMMIFPTFHPAASLYSAKYKQHLIKDFQLLGHELAKRENC